jgi:type IX secretion system substrate protein
MTMDPVTKQLPANIHIREAAFTASIPAREIHSMQKTSGLAAQSWEPRGPDNIGGRCRAFAVDVSNPMNLLAAGVSGGMWRSIDDGKSWVLVSDKKGLLSASCIAQDTRPGKSNTWYYGTGEYSTNHQEFYRGDGMYKSIDNGVTWNSMASTSSHSPQLFSNWSYIHRVLVDHTELSTDILYAATAGAVFRSSDGGGSWEKVLGRLSADGEPISYTSDLRISPNGVLYATLNSVVLKPTTGEITSIDESAGGLFRSDDGLNWTEITPENFPTSTWRVVAGIAPGDENTVYFLSSNLDEGFETVGVSGSAGYAGLYKYTYISGDGSGMGGLWEDLSDNLPAFGNYGRFNTQQGYNLVVKVAPDNPSVVYLGATSLYRSTDGFSTNSNTSWIGGYHHDFKLEDPLFNWLDISYPNHHPDVHEILFSRDNPKVMYSATDGGVSKTLDCESDAVEWASLNNGMITTQFYALGIHPTGIGDDRILGGMQDNGSFASVGNENEWKMVASGDGFGCEISPNEDHTYFCSMYAGILTKTSADQNVDVSAVKRFSGPALVNDGFDFVTEWCLDPNDPKVAYLAGSEYMYRHTDINDPDVLNTWEQLPETGPVRGEISAIAPTHDATTGMYFGTSEGWLFYLDDVRNSTAKPTRIDRGKLPFKSYISCISVDKTVSSKVLVVVSNYSVPSLFYSSDGGTSWEDVSGNLEENPDGSGAGPSCRWAETVTRAGHTIYLVGTSTGLYSTTELAGPATIWAKEGANVIGNALVSCMRSRNSDGFVAVGTYGSGVFASNVNPVSVEGTPEIPTALFMEQNYPNPVTSSTSVNIHIPEAQQVNVTIHNSVGAEIGVVYNGIAQAGVQNMSVATERLPAGQYFLRLSAPGFAQTRMMTVVK